MLVRAIAFFALWIALTASCVSVLAAELPKPLTDQNFRSYPRPLAKLGQLLFYDRVLSGTYRVSCASCHSHARASSNGTRLDGVEIIRDELAVNGDPIYEAFKPSSKHAPPLFNLGAKQFTRLFADGRISRSTEGGFNSPAGDALPEGLNDILAVQALFPAVQNDELVGTVDNDILAVAHRGNEAIWYELSKRVRRLPEYKPYFQAAYPGLDFETDLSIVHIANAIGAFVGTEWRSDNAPFDQYLQGNDEALSAAQKSGAQLFYGPSGCSSCHAGALQTDHVLHKFADKNEQAKRTPSLRNITVTSPYGSNGNVSELKDYVAVHADDVGAANLPSNEEVFADMIAFLSSLTDQQGVAGVLGKPAEVPSSLALD